MKLAQPLFDGLADSGPDARVATQPPTVERSIEAGVPLPASLGVLWQHPAVSATMLGLVIGKPLGIFGTTFLVARFTHAELDATVRWRWFVMSRLSW